MKKTDHDRRQHHLQRLIRAAAPDILRENTHTATGLEAMTEQERAQEVMRRYGSKHDANRNAIKSKP